MNRGALSAAGLLLGAVLGYPISYFFQPGALRAKMSLGDYVQHIGDIMQSNDLRVTAIGTWIGCTILFCIIGAVLGALLPRKVAPT